MTNHMICSLPPGAPGASPVPARIDSFRGRWAFLSNFCGARVEHNGRVWLTAEHAYQAAKTSDPVWHNRIAATSSPGKAKLLGQKLPLRKNWGNLRVGIMQEILEAKFRDPWMAAELDATGDAELVEGNDWGDVFWGMELVSDFHGGREWFGENWLGILLMVVRADNRERWGVEPGQPCPVCARTYPVRWVGVCPVCGKGVIRMLELQRQKKGEGTNDSR